ncbi:unnamed protein product, partial [marine sediment metagenome]
GRILIIISPKILEEEIEMSFGLNLILSFFATFSAKEEIVFGIFLPSKTGFFGIINVCPFEIGFISKTAIAFLFSSIL